MGLFGTRAKEGKDSAKELWYVLMMPYKAMSLVVKGHVAE